MAIKNFYSVYIDGINRTSRAVMPLKWGYFLDERLDECYLTLRHVKKKSFPPLTPVDIVFHNVFYNGENQVGKGKDFANEEKHFLVANDSATENPIGSGYYDHELYIIEVTKYAECIVCDTQTVTNDIGRVYTKNAQKVTPSVNVGSASEVYTPTNFKSPLNAGGFDFPLAQADEPWTSEIFPEKRNVMVLNVDKVEIYQNDLSPQMRVASKEYRIIYARSGNDYYPKKATQDGITLTYNSTTKKLLGVTPLTFNLSSGLYYARYTHSIIETENENIDSKAEQKIQNQVTYQFLVVENRLPLKKWTITDVVNRALDLAEPLRRGEKPRFRLNGMRADGTIITPENKQEGEEVGQAYLFDKILSPQFSFTKQTLRECMQEIGKFIHGEFRLDVKKDADGYYFEVLFDMYGGRKRWSCANYKPMLRTTSHAVESFASALDSHAENLINTLDKYSGVIVEPYTDGNKTVRTESLYTRIEDGNMLITTQYPIYAVEKLEWVKKNEEGNEVASYDITPYVFESSDYSRLSSWSNKYGDSKLYALRFTQGQPNIDGLNFKRQLLTDTATANGPYSIVSILRAVTGNSNLSINSYPSLAFRVTYTPIYNTRVSQTKTYYKEVPRAADLIFNQQANIVESRAYGENLKGAIARLGNVEETRTYMLTRYYCIPKVGELFDDDYYISAVAVEMLPTYFKCTIALSKDFNRLSQYIGISSEKRYSEISETQASERNVLYREYVVIGDAETPDDDSRIGDRLMTAISDTFIQSRKIKPLTNVAAWGSSYQGNKTPAVDLPVVSSAFGNSISFSWKYEDNFSAGTVSTWHQDKDDEIRGYFQNSYQYTDYYGRIYYYNFDLQPNGAQTNGFALPMLPESEIPTQSSGLFSTVGQEPYVLRKDNREALQVNVQIDFVTNQKEMIIGSALASYCAAVRGSDKSLKAKLYIFPEELDKFIDHVEGTVSVKLNTLPSMPISIYFPQNGKFSIHAEQFPASGKAWAIVTAQTELPSVMVEDEKGEPSPQSEVIGGDVLLAKNIEVSAGQDFTPIYFTRKREIFDKTVWKDKL